MEHDLALIKCLQRLIQIGLTLNLKKCKFLQTELGFFRHVFSKDGVKPDPKRIQDIIEVLSPNSIRDVRSFLEMLNYCSKFIDDFSTLTKHKQKQFTWSHER